MEIGGNVSDNNAGIICISPEINICTAEVYLSMKWKYTTHFFFLL